VKILHTDLSSNTEARARFLREGYAANSVDHPGAVRVLDDDVDDVGCPFLVMELLDGESLEDRRNRFDGGVLNEDETLSIADQLLEVLIAAHAKDIVHRDIKPENVFITRTGEVKVLDFGIARCHEPSGIATQVNSAIGTPAFMAPEQARGLWTEVDGRTDLWAVGATLFTCLTGEFVHTGRTTNEHLLHAMSAPARPIASVVPTIATIVAHLVDRALAFDKERRWPTAARMQQAVRHAYSDRNGRPITTHPKLIIPESTSNRGSVALLPTTGQPIAETRFVVPMRNGWMNAVAMVAILVGILVIAGAGARLVASAPRSEQRSRASTIAPEPSQVVPPIQSAPEVAATDLPLAEASAPPPAPAPLVRPIALSRSPPTPAPVPTPPPSSADSAIRDCTPPYTTDPNGHLHWKIQCL
jgi:eukaryotic-like serine/threonine-protein kinase